MSLQVHVYLKHPPNTKTLVAERAKVVDGMLCILTVDSDEPDYAFNMDHVIYWTSKELP